MKYCDECADEHGFPEQPRRVIGRCEWCGFKGEVNDRSGSQLRKRGKEQSQEKESDEQQVD